MLKSKLHKRLMLIFAGLMSVIATYKWFIQPLPPHELRYQVFNFTEVALFETNFFYLGINLFVLSLPLLLSFDKKVHFYRKWKAVFLSIFVTALLFIPWDVVFTARGIWGFNPSYYISETVFFGLPMEEWLFFLVVPYACIFIYECMLYYISKNWFRNTEPFITSALLILFIILAFYFWDRAYTSVTALYSAAFLLIARTFTGSYFRARFYMAFLVSILPFLLVNGALTGLFTQQPVVIYNDAQNLGLRIFSVPIDDAMYSFLMLGINITLFETFVKRNIPAA